MSLKLLLLLSSILSVVFFTAYSQTPDKQNSDTETKWILSEIKRLDKNVIQFWGTPEIHNSKYGEVVHFNGYDEGFLLNEMPLRNLEQFTIEAIFYPDNDGDFAQRFFHCGEITGSRVLLETRSKRGNWYFDAYIKTSKDQLALIDSTRLHPLAKWYHLAFVNNHGKLSTYIDGIKELEGSVEMVPLKKGRTSIGVRQNLQSWFKGSVYSIKISPKALKPEEFEMK